MSTPEVHTPALSCGRTACRAAHDWVGGRCPGNSPRVVVDVATAAAEVRAALHPTTRSTP